MADHALDDPRVQLDTLATEARRGLARDLDEFVDAFARYGVPSELLTALRAYVRVKFTQSDPLRSSADLVLLQLVRDASRLLNATDPLNWGSDVKNWNRIAAQFVEPDA